MALKATILLAEDDTSLAFMLKDALEEEGYKVIHCVDGQTAIETFDKSKFDICLLDIMMPYKDGYTVARKIRQQSDFIPVLFLSTKSVEEHIRCLWDVLTRQPVPASSGSLLFLPHAYVVPGDRFREVYYWDSFFTMLGLQVHGRWDLIQNMIDNFSYLIDTIGFIPNGNRTYYLSRAHPPFYSLMIKLLEEKKGIGTLEKYKVRLQKEYDFWMDGANNLSESTDAIRRVVRMPDGSILNRYWDDSTKPRPESYEEDVELVHTLYEDEIKYRHIRAAAESGWDFSSRWFEDGKSMSTIDTTNIIPIDLNTLLYHHELVLADVY
ncbi:MAG: response regulator, partial [Sphingobacteriales bacterium]